jgi:antitoxin Phd
VIAVITVTSAEARERLTELLENVERNPVVIIREGHPPAFLVSSTEVLGLADVQGREQAAAAFSAWSAEAKKRLSPEAASLTDEEVNRLVHELRESRSANRSGHEHAGECRVASRFSSA